MTTPTFWLLVCFLVAVLYFVVTLADNLVLKGRGAGRKFWARHVVADFPYPDQCFDCRKQDCVGCEILSRGNGV